jgi:hypothetical protein
MAAQRSRYWTRPAQGHRSLWTADEEHRLIQELSRGDTLQDMATAHGRTPGAIRARLLNLVDPERVPYVGPRVNDQQRSWLRDAYLVSDGHQPLKDAGFYRQAVDEIGLDPAAVYETMRSMWPPLDECRHVVAGTQPLEIGCACGQRYLLTDPGAPTYDDGYQVGHAAGFEAGKRAAVGSPA